MIFLQNKTSLRPSYTGGLSSTFRLNWAKRVMWRYFSGPEKAGHRKGERIAEPSVLHIRPSIPSQNQECVAAGCRASGVADGENV